MKDFTRIPIRIDKLFLINKVSLANGLFCLGVIYAFFDSLHPWFLWPLGGYGSLLIALILTSYYALSRTLPDEMPPKGRFIMLFCAYAIFRLYMFAVGEFVTFMSFATAFLQIVYFYVIFREDGSRLKRALVITSKIMAGILLASMLFFILFLGGFGLPSVNAVYGDNLYSFTNYFLFLLDDRSIWAIIPRFQSVFLEPSHMGIACVFLLMTDIGNWKRWYNVVMIAAVLISFSLEAYVLMFCLVFLGKWIQRKNFVRNLLILVLGFTTLVVGSFFYNDGDNMLNQMIVMRLEVEDGEVAGNNRTSVTFDADYESFLSSSDVFTGRKMSEDWGNSGYKVFVYTHGLIGVFLLALLYLLILYSPRNMRPAMCALCLAAIHFVVRAHMMWASCIIPMFFMAQHFRLSDSLTNLLIPAEDGAECDREQ